MPDSPMRIMLVVNEFPPQKVAGTAVATQALAWALHARGQQVHVVVTTHHPDKGAVTEEVGGIRISWMPDRPVRGVGIAWRAYHLLRIVRRYRPDVLQGQAISCGLLAAIAGGVCSIPSIVYAQGQDVYQASDMQLRSEIRWACRWSTKVVAVTRHLATRLAGVGACADACVIPHGFNMLDASDSRARLRAQWQAGNAQKVVLNVGRLEHIKGQDVLLRAWPEVIAAEPDACLWLVGDGEQRASLEFLSDALGIVQSVRFLGYMDAAGVADCLAAADLFVLPSRSEAFGIVLLEAMARSLPVVASCVGGVPEVLPDAGDSRMVVAENSEALAMGIVQALRDNRFPSQKNRAWAMGFEWSANVRRFEEMYMDVSG